MQRHKTLKLKCNLPALAGDYTFADCPVNIEGAVHSDMACADLVCNSSLPLAPSPKQAEGWDGGGKLE